MPHQLEKQRAHRQRHATLALARVLSVLVVNVAAADELKPFEASYGWNYRGMNVAVSTLTLEQRGDTWSYRSRSEPRGIGKLFSQRPKQQSVLKVSDAGTRPLSYHADDGTKSNKRTVDVKYDWERGRVTGVYEETPVDLPLKDGVQDDASVEVAMMVELLRGRTPDRFSLLNKNSVREYHYVREDETTLHTPMGDVATVVYRSERENSPRVTRFWCAPNRGYIPMRVEQTRGKEVEWTMEIRSLKRDGGA